MTDGEGGAWSEAEVRETVRAYFSMLSDDLRGVSYSKAETKRRLGEKLNSRSEGAIDWKFGNISAVLDELDLRSLDGFAPASNYQESLRRAVEQYLVEHPETRELLERASHEEPEGRTAVSGPEESRRELCLSRSHGIGYKELSEADLGRSPKSNQTHIGLSQDVLENWETAGTEIAVLVRECHEPEVVAAPIGPISTPSGGVRSPKLRKGSLAEDLPDDRPELSLALPKIRSSASPEGADLIYGTLEGDRTLLMLVQHGGHWEEEVRNVLGDSRPGALTAGTPRHRRLADTVQRLLDEALSFPATVGQNIIYFGPPGTGKSHSVKVATTCFTVFRTVFHPEYSYGDFVGTYKPVVGSDSSGQVTGFDGSTIDRPVNYYAFEPGVLTLALEEAHRDPDSPVALVIEEINRGDCAAIFGDFFQLLDRDREGRSEYPLRVKGPVEKYLRDRGILSQKDAAVAFPANFSVFATMNTSDQALFPMDSAFKRRWKWKSVSIEYDAPELTDVVIDDPGGTGPVPWLGFLRELNDRIVSHTRQEDKRIGPWYILPDDGRIPTAEVREKLLFYLWHDVFRGHPEQLFRSDIRTFDSLQEEFDAGGLREICPWLAAHEGERPHEGGGEAATEQEEEYPTPKATRPLRAAETDTDSYASSEGDSQQD